MEVVEEIATKYVPEDVLTKVSIACQGARLMKLTRHDRSS